MYPCFFCSPVPLKTRNKHLLFAFIHCVFRYFQEILLYLRGSQKPPQVNWIYRNINHDSLPVKEVSGDILNGIYKNNQTKSMTDDLVQQAMTLDVSWDGTLFSDLHDGLPVVSLGANQASLRSSDGFQLMHSQSRDQQQPINVEVLEQLCDQQQNASFEQLALDLMMNPPRTVLQEPHHDVNLQPENDLTLNLLRSLFLQYPPMNSLHHNEESNTLDMPPTPPDSNSSHCSPLDDIDDETLNPLSPFMTDDLYDYAMADSNGLEDLF